MTRKLAAALVAAALILAPAAAIPTMAADSASFSFTPGFDGSYIDEGPLVISGIARPDAGFVYGIAGGEECAAEVDPTSGAWSCSINVLQTTENLEISVYGYDGTTNSEIGTATVHVLLPPYVDGLGDGTPTILWYNSYPRISGTAEPSNGGQTSTVHVAVSSANVTTGCTATVDDEGLYDCGFDGPLDAGSYDLEVTQQPYWSGTNRSLSDAMTLDVRTPTIVVDGATDNSFTVDSGAPFSISGSLEGDEIPDDVLAMRGSLNLAGSTAVPLDCTTLTADYDWSCALAEAPARAGSYALDLVVKNGSATAARSRAFSVTVRATAPPATGPTPAPTPTPSPTPTPTPAPTPGPTPTPEPLDFAITLDSGGAALHPGDAVTISSSGLPESTVITAEIHSTPAALGSMTVGTTGSFSLSATIPADVEPGAHEIVVTATAPGFAVSEVRTPITVEAAAAATPTPVPTPTSGPDVAAVPAVDDSAANPRNKPGAPNSVSASLQPFWEVFASPVAIGTSLLAGLAFLVLVAFPAELLTGAVVDRYNYVQRSAGARPVRSWWAGLTAWLGARPILAGVTLVALAALVSGFADPNFGFDLASLRLFIACFITAVIISYGTWFITTRVLLRRWEVPTSIALRPFTIVLSIVGVILSRLLDFSPGFLFGLMLGLSFPPATPAIMRSRARLLRTSLILGFATASWFVYSAAYALDISQYGFGGALAQDTLAALSTGGLSGMLVAMLPFLYLDGQDIWDHSKRIWASIYAVIAVVFFFIVAPKPSSWADLGPRYGPWVILLGCFTAVALVAYFWLRILARRERRRLALVS